MSPRFRSHASAVTAGLRQRLSPYSVTYIVDNYLYVSRVGEFTSQFQIIFVEKHDRLALEPCVGIRSDEVEAVFHRWSGFSTKDATNTATIGGMFETLFERQFSVEIHSDRDVHSAAQVLEEWYIDWAVPYFTTFNSVPRIDAILNEEPWQFCKHIANDHFRACKGLIVAKLCGRENFEALFAIYDERMKRWGERIYLENWLPLIADLRNM